MGRAVLILGVGLVVVGLGAVNIWLGIFAMVVSYTILSDLLS
jgi:hypothetical protein